MIYRFLEKDERPKPTIAMDYSFGRKTVKSLVSDIRANYIHLSFSRFSGYTHIDTRKFHKINLLT